MNMKSFKYPQNYKKKVQCSRFDMLWDTKERSTVLQQISSDLLLDVSFFFFFFFSNQGRQEL